MARSGIRRKNPARARGATVLQVSCGLAVLCGCSNIGVNNKLSDLEAEERRRQERISELDAQISSAEQRVEIAKAEATYRECLATRAVLESEIAVEKAECLARVAERAACIANNESELTKGTATGCGTGWLFALLTGGAAAPAVLLGCAGGAVLSDGSKKQCGEPPTCGVDDPAPAVLASHGMTRIPTCAAPMVVEPKVPVARAVSDRAVARASNGCRGRIEWIELDAPRTKRTGEAWDADGSGPDLVYTIAVDGERIYRSPKYEAFSWNHKPGAGGISSGQVVVIEVVDRDLVSEDRIGVFQWTVPDTAPEAPVLLVNGRASAKVQVTCSATR